MENKNNNPAFVYNAFDLLRFAWDHKWMLIAMSVIAFIVSVIVSLNITPKFRAQVVLFPASSISVSKTLVETSSISMDSRDILSFGSDDEAERMLQILHSSQIREHIIRKFDLMNHYEIDTAAPYPYTRLDSKYKGNIRFRRTEFMSIEVSVLDAEPQVSADIANEIVAYIDSTVHNMRRERALEAFAIVEKEYLASQQQVRLISDSLKKTGGHAVETGLTRWLESEIDRQGQLKEKYVSARINVEQRLPEVFVVDKATKAERKYSPKRSIIVMVSTLSVFAFTLLLLLIISQIKVRN